MCFLFNFRYVPKQINSFIYIELFREYTLHPLQLKDCIICAGLFHVFCIVILQSTQFCKCLPDFRTRYIDFLTFSRRGSPSASVFQQRQSWMFAFLCFDLKQIQTDTHRTSKLPCLLATAAYCKNAPYSTPYVSRLFIKWERDTPNRIGFRLWWKISTHFCWWNLSVLPSRRPT